MALKEIEVGTGSRVLIDVPHEHKRLLVKVDEEEISVISDQCKHRGGPIHLCYKGSDDILRCPWHDRKVLRNIVCHEVTAIYFKSQRKLRLISRYHPHVLWPVRVLSASAQATVNARIRSALPSHVG